MRVWMIWNQDWDREIQCFWTKLSQIYVTHLLNFMRMRLNSSQEEEIVRFNICFWTKLSQIDWTHLTNFFHFIIAVECVCWEDDLQGAIRVLAEAEPHPPLAAVQGLTAGELTLVTVPIHQRLQSKKLIGNSWTNNAMINLSVVQGLTAGEHTLVTVPIQHGLKYKKLMGN